MTYLPRDKTSSSHVAYIKDNTFWAYHIPSQFCDHCLILNYKHLHYLLVIAYKIMNTHLAFINSHLICFILHIGKKEKIKI